MRDALGYITTFQYDPANRQKLIVDPHDEHTLLDYYPDGTLLSETRPGPRVTSYQYDLAQRRTRVADPLGRVSTTVYDANGLVWSQADPSGEVTTFGYDAADRETARIDALGRITTRVYDDAGRQVATVDPLGAVTTTAYDQVNRPVAVTNPLGCTTTSVYNPVGLQIAQENPLGERTSFTYDLLNRQTAVTDAEGHVTTTVYDALGRTIARVDAQGHITSSVYDAADRRIRLIDANGHTVTFLYDAAGRDLGSIDPLGRRVTFMYDAVGNRVRTIDARGNTTTMVYNGNRELTDQYYPDGRHDRYEYDLAGNRTLMEDATGVTTSVYDSRNNLLSVTNPDGKTVSYSYDGCGQCAVNRRHTMTDPEGGVYTYSYDEAGQLIELVDPRGQATFQDYDLGGRLVRRQAGNGAVTSFVYDCADRLKQLQNHRSDGTPVNIFTYTYDHAGNRTSALELSGDLTTWTYDPAYQLVHEQRSGTHEFSVTYTYDPAGNRTTQDDAGERTTYTYDAANQLLTEQSSAGLTTYVYDESGNRIEKNAPAETTYYTWDEDNRLVAAEPPAGVTTLVYNADGLRVGKETPSEARKFIYDFRKLLQETDGADDPQRWYTFTTEEYGDLISQYDGADTLYHQYDGPGSTDALLDEWETATDRYAHRAFGLEAAHSGTTDNPFTYVGRQSYYKDPELELYLLGARYYDPQAGRFLSHDPLRYQSDDINLYAYVHNNPVNATDPSGTGEVRGWASLSDRQKVEVWAGLPPTVRYLLSTTFWPSEVLLLRGRYGRSRLLEQISVGKAEMRRDLSRRFPFEGSVDDQLATWPELTLIERREALRMLPESRRQHLELRLDRDLLRRETQQARHRIRSGGLEFPERNRPSAPVEHLVELPPDVAPRSTPPAVAPPAVPADAGPPPRAAMAGSEDVSRTLREMGSVLADLGRQLTDIAQGTDTGAAPQAAAPPDYAELYQDKFDELAAKYGLKELRDAYARGRRGAEKNYLGAWREIEGRSRQHAEDELAEYARQAAQAIEQAEQRQGRESLLAVADALAAIREVLDKVPLSDLAIPVVTDIIFRAAQLLTLDLDLDEARAAHRQIVEAHVNATNPGHADVDALEQAGEARRRVTGQAGEAVGGLLGLSFFAIGAAFGTAASGGARRGEAAAGQPAAKTSKGQPKKQSPPQRVVDNQKRIQENWTRGRAPKGIVTPSPKLQRWAQQGGYIDPRTNKWVPTSEKLAADHVYPKSLIEKLPRFEKLTRGQKDFLLNYLGNFEPLPKVWNSSKLNRLADDWAKTPMGRQASDEYIVRLRERQQAFEGFARELIQFWTD